jgi:hypothetical protein
VGKANVDVTDWCDEIRRASSHLLRDGRDHAAGNPKLYMGAVVPISATHM